MSRTSSTLVALTLGYTFVANPLFAQTTSAGANDERWQFAVAPYFWASGMSGEVSFKGIPPQEVEASFSDIISNFDMGLLGHFEGHKGRVGFTTDTIYMNLGAELPDFGLGIADAEVDVRQLITSAAGFYRVSGASAEAHGSFVDLLAGARYTGTKTTLDGRVIDGSGRSINWLDALVGVRFHAPLGEKFAITGHGDIAGLGSDFTWQLMGDLRYQLSSHWTLGGGYRHMDIDYDKGEGVDRKLYKIAVKGPYLGVVYAW